MSSAAIKPWATSGLVYGRDMNIENCPCTSAEGHKDE
jgi:hypothetical protein